jgi:hypothetical protein
MFSPGEIKAIFSFRMKIFYLYDNNFFTHYNGSD